LKESSRGEETQIKFDYIFKPREAGTAGKNWKMRGKIKVLDFRQNYKVLARLPNDNSQE
jgi:hypothetical protein